MFELLDNIFNYSMVGDMMSLREYLRNSWFFRKYEVTDDMPLIEKVWRIQWNQKHWIMFECGILYFVLSFIFR